MRRDQLLLFLLLFLPFIIGSSTPISPLKDNTFNLVCNTVFQPGSNVGPVFLYTNGINEDEFKFRLLKIEDIKSFYKGLLSSEYAFDIIGKEFLLKYTRQVKEWKDNVVNNINLGRIDDPGTYILQAVRGDRVAYCAVVVSKYAVIYKSTSNDILSFVQDVNSGKMVNNVKFTYIKDSKEYNSVTDKEGLSLITIKKDEHLEQQTRTLLFADIGSEIIVNNPYLYDYAGNNEIAYTYTNQPVYRPGQQVFFKSIVREKRGNDYNVLTGTTFNVTVKSPKNKEIYNKELAMNETGALFGDFQLEPEADLGNYNILIKSGNKQFYSSFSVEEYKKPEFEVNVSVPKNNYANGDKIEGKIKADYYFGSPVTKGTVTLNIYKQYFWRPWWFNSNFSWFYRGFQKTGIRDWGNMQFINSTSGELNEQGEYQFSYDIKEDDQWDYIYVISAEVTDQSRRAVSGSSSIYVTRGSFALTASTDNYFAELGKAVVFRVNAVDFNEKPVETNFKIVLKYQNENNWYNKNIISYSDSITGRTDEFGKAQLLYMPKIQQSGYYNFIASAKDEKGRLITSQGSFYYGNNQYYNYDYNQGIQIITDKDIYKKGDSLTAFIFLPDSTTDLLLTYESNKIFYYKKHSVSSNKFVIKEILDGRFSPSFNISVTYIKNGRFRNMSKMVGVLDEEKFLDISVQPNKKQYKPGDYASYLVTVKDKKGNPVPNADLSVGLIDESVYAIKEESIQDINSFFYSPTYSYINVSNSYNKYSYGNSRKLTGIDKYSFNEKNLNKTGNGTLIGTILNTKNITLEIIIINDNNYYSTFSDSSGKYSFSNISTGDYDLFIYGESGLVFSSQEKITVKKNSKFDILISNSLVVKGDKINDLNAAEVKTLPSTGIRKEMSLQSGAVLKEKMESPVNYKEAVVRSNFSDAAYWNPNIFTNDKGEATVSFKMPDNLTTWRATVRVITAATLVGQQINKTITRKDLLVRMETPRFFREGDQLTVSTIVHNYLNEKKRTKITFKTSNIRILDSQINTPGYSTNLYNRKENQYELSIGQNTELRIDWILSVDAPYTSAKLSVEALTDQESDAMELTVPVLPKGIKKITVLNADFEDSHEQTIKFNIPNDIDLRSAKVNFSVSPSLSGTILKAIDELAGYPYGCVEQTMSRFLPTLIAANAFNEIKAPLSSNIIKELPKMIEAGLKRLYGFQHQDGGWGWWENDESNEHMTAYVIYGMALSRKAGYNVNPEVFTLGEQKLVSSINEGKADETSLAYLVYSLSTADPDKYKDMLLKKINELSVKKLNPYSLSLLLLSAENLNDKNIINKLTIKLKAMSVENGGFITWKGKEWHYSWQDDEVQTTAFAVKALLNAGDKNVDKSVRWLLLQRQGFAWRSTQETASIIYALTDYLKITNELNPDYNVKVYINNELQINKNFTSSDVYSEPKVNELIKGLQKGDNIIRIVKEGKGKVYFSGLNEYFSQDLNASGNKNMFNVDREYFVLVPVQKEGRIIYQKKELNGPITSGEDLFVKTKVSSSTANLQYFMLEDMLPSGFEVVKDENKYEIEGENNYHYRNYYDFGPWRWFYADKEFRDEKVSFFVTYASQEMEFTYIMKAQIPGSYNSMPAQASLMYYPEYNGNSSTGKFVIKDK